MSETTVTDDDGPIDGTEIAGAFRAARGWLGWSRSKAAKRVGIGLSTLRSLEDGTASSATVCKVIDSYRAGGVGMADLPDGGIFIGLPEYADKCYGGR